MGHFHCENISRLVVGFVYAKGQASIAQMVESAMKRGETIHASEGEYSDRAMLEQGIEELTLIHADAGILEPIFPSQTIRDLYHEWRDDNGDGPEWWEHRPQSHEAMMALPFRFAPGARQKYRDGKIHHYQEIDH